MSAVLEVSDLHKAFGGVRAVNGVSFAVNEGELVALIGPNGSGKTTCFNLLNGQLRPDRGSIRFAGHEVAGMAPRRVWRLGLGRTFQITATFSSMLVRENVQVALQAYHRAQYGLIRHATSAYRDEALALLARVGIRDQAERVCGVLAHGDLKRLDLAIALANRPRLLLMDEPTAGMASAESVELMQLIDEIVAEREASALFTEHDMEVVFSRADRVLVLHQGRLVAQGNPATVRADPHVREIYLGTDVAADAGDPGPALAGHEPGDNGGGHSPPPEGDRP